MIVKALVRPHPRHSKQVRYRVHPEGGDPTRAFVIGPTQAIRSIDPETAEITVYAIRPGESDGNRGPGRSAHRDDLRPNIFIAERYPLVVALAQQAAGDERGPLAGGSALERFVYREVEKKDFTQAFATAAEVAKKPEGMAPSTRCCWPPGPVPAASPPAWPSAWSIWKARSRSSTTCGPRYTSINAGFRLMARWAWAASGADHLEIAQSNLAGASASSAFLPVVQVAGRRE